MENRFKKLLNRETGNLTEQDVSYFNLKHLKNLLEKT